MDMIYDVPPGQKMRRLIQDAEKAVGWAHITAIGEVLYRAQALHRAVLGLEHAPVDAEILKREIEQWKEQGYTLNGFTDLWRKELKDFVIYQAIEAFRKYHDELMR